MHHDQDASPRVGSALVEPGSARADPRSTGGSLFEESRGFGMNLLPHEMAVRAVGVMDRGKPLNLKSYGVSAVRHDGVRLLFGYCPHDC